MESQSLDDGDDDFDIGACSDDESILDRMLDDKNDIRVGIRTMTIIENLPVTNAEFSECLLSRLPVRDSSVLSSLTGSSGRKIMVAARVLEKNQL